MIEDFLSRHEGKTLEFKENTNNLESILKSIIAFANTSGGTIIIGVKDKSKEIIGVSDPLFDEEKLTNSISDNISPLIIPSIEITSYKKRELLIIRIPHIPGPYYLKKKGPENGVYIRFGSTNRIADLEILQTLRLLVANKTFDELPSMKGSIDKNYLISVFKKIQKKPTQNQCHMLGIYTDHFGKIMPSIGGILLFSNKHTLIFPDSVIRCACFKGKTKEKIIDSIDIHSPLPSSIEEIIAFIDRNSRHEAVIGKIRRVDIPQYPQEAIRELIINALVHTDYSLKGLHIQIALFSDRIEVTNPGGLPLGQTMKKALAGYSKLRNHVIGRVFRKLQLIEQWGSGLQKIYALCKKIGLKSPIFEEQDSHFRATIYSSKQEKMLFSKNEQRLINYLKKHRTIQTQQASKLWKLSNRASRTRLSKMAREGSIIRISTSEKDPYAVYVLNKDYI